MIASLDRLFGRYISALAVRRPDVSPIIKSAFTASAAPIPQGRFFRLAFRLVPWASPLLPPRLARADRSKPRARRRGATDDLHALWPARAGTGLSRADRLSRLRSSPRARFRGARGRLRDHAGPPSGQAVLRRAGRDPLRSVRDPDA